MNIFVLDLNPKLCAKMYCDKHIVKMILEYAQILSNAHRIIDNILDDDTDYKYLYKITHKNNPCNKWARNSIDNYKWLYNLFIECCNEYTFRYKKTHLCDTNLRNFLKNIPKNLKKINITERPQCMPEYCKNKDVVKAYRNYYKYEKKQIAKWKYSEIPKWY